MAKRTSQFSAVDKVIAVGLALVWFGGSLIAVVVGLRHRVWAVLIAGPLGLCYGLLWLQAARMGRRLNWREGICPWRRR